ncbi:MAG: peptidoglycan DD-metalloendopeptidase family protein, partial [Bacteroidota bacterium]
AQLAKIKEVNKILNETANAKRVSVGQLNALQAQINARQALISNTQKELALIDEDIIETSLIIKALEKDLIDLKKEYAKMIYEASKISSTYNRLVFVFSSSNFNEAFRRVQYLKQYSHARKVQVEQIQKTKKYLERQNKRIAQQKEKKLKLVSSYKDEKKQLDRLIVAKNKVVKQLASRERDLRARYNREKIALKKLENQLLAVINKEIRKTSGTENATKITLTPETKVISNSFAANRRKLIWPVSTGFISKKYGRSVHPIHKIVEDNRGVNIQTKKGATVRAVFDGEVVYVGERPGFGYTIMINHGEYFTVYSNIKNVKVKKGSRLKRKTVIGDVLTNTQGVSELLFCVSKNTKFQ